MYTWQKCDTCSLLDPNFIIILLIVLYCKQICIVVTEENSICWKSFVNICIKGCWNIYSCSCLWHQRNKNKSGNTHIYFDILISRQCIVSVMQYVICNNIDCIMLDSADYKMCHYSFFVADSTFGFPSWSKYHFHRLVWIAMLNINRKYK